MKFFPPLVKPYLVLVHCGYCTFAMYHAKSTVRAFFKISVDHLFDKLELLFGKIKRLLILDSKICTNYREQLPTCSKGTSFVDSIHYFLTLQTLRSYLKFSFVAPTHFLQN